MKRKMIGFLCSRVHSYSQTLTFYDLAILKFSLSHSIGSSDGVMWKKRTRKQVLFAPKTINLRNGRWGVESKSPRPRFVRWRDDKPLISTILSLLLPEYQKKETPSNARNKAATGPPTPTPESRYLSVNPPICPTTIQSYPYTLAYIPNKRVTTLKSGRKKITCLEIVQWESLEDILRSPFTQDLGWFCRREPSIILLSFIDLSMA
jgi:hypothetical protein